MSYRTKNDGVVNSDSEKQFKPITFPFEKNGFKHELIKRDGLICLVRRTRLGHPNITPHFEAVKLRQLPAWVHPATDAQIPPREVYPDAERWGDIGFTYKTMDAALVRFDSLAPSPAPRRGLGLRRYSHIAETTIAQISEVAA